MTSVKLFYLWRIFFWRKNSFLWYFLTKRDFAHVKTSAQLFTWVRIYLNELLKKFIIFFEDQRYRENRLHLQFPQFDTRNENLACKVDIQSDGRHQLAQWHLNRIRLLLPLRHHLRLNPTHLSILAIQQHDLVVEFTRVDLLRFRVHAVHDFGGDFV